MWGLRAVWGLRAGANGAISLAKSSHIGPKSLDFNFKSNTNDFAPSGQFMFNLSFFRIPMILGRFGESKFTPHWLPHEAPTSHGAPPYVTLRLAPTKKRCAVRTKEGHARLTWLWI